MSLPKSLNMSLSRFDKTSKEIIRITSDKTTYLTNETTTYRFPSAGVLDMESLALFATLNLTANGSPTAAAFTFELGKLIRRMELIINGQVVWGDSLTDFGLAYAIKKRLAQPDYSLESSTSSSLYDVVRATSPGTANATVGYPAFIKDMPRFFTNMRYVPLSAFGSVELRVTWDLSRFAVPATVVAASAAIASTHLLCARVNFAENMLDQLVASRISQAPLELASEAWTTMNGNAVSAGSISFPFTLNSQSIDYICSFLRPTTAAGATYYDTDSGGADATWQLLIGGVPQSSHRLTVPEVYYATVIDAMDGGGNILVSPQLGSTVSDWQNKNFVYAHRLKFLGADGYENDRLVSGMSSYGQNVPMAVEATISDNNQVPHVVIIHTRTFELSGGSMLRSIQ